MLAILQSEFVWGIVLGIVLNILASRAQIGFQRQEATLRVKALVRDVTQNLSDYAKSLDENRDRSEVIYPDLLDLIIGEISVWGRNREHMVLVESDQVRRDVRDFLSTAAKSSVETKALLTAFSESFNKANAAEGALKTSWQTDADQKLNLARSKADRLIQHLKSGLPKKTAAYFER